MINYTNKKEITAADLAQVFKNSGIHRPVDDLPRLKLMIKNADILWTAWDNKKLVGIARAITDYSYACYLSDLAVDKTYQRHGIGRRLIKSLHSQIGPDVSLLLLSAPSALEYYPKVNFEKIDNAFLKRRRPF
ncbi:GCN5-like N-acetyltransferase [Liquorilactobacillus aquaticus DSM 21051]|uniref:GCN5-like N-acetyltransferase n=1 Tax=Liquorilactobacillus aquaticus DSM 21051 TaxID=1423725 RepID=A0A0R2CZ25_9LACO|nr:GNAT family N-acetyltransferase [Liquorilactobacillus aquaticus]KRM97096.1 GCN5-like N-acetyltransferase [Liquorilactobacillus aquaticus DSM 21051]